MNFKNLSLICLASILTFSALYAPQPLLPILSKQFDVSASIAGLIVTFTLIPLSFSPFFYGIILETVSARKVILVAVFLLGASEVLLGLSASFSQILFIRLFQGFLIPAILTSLMTYVSKVSGSEIIQKSMSIYIASTIIGGFSGRAVSGVISYVFNWRISFIFLGVCLLCIIYFIRFLEKDVSVNAARPDFKNLLVVLKDRKFVIVYAAIFLSFFCFAAVLNYLPDHLSKINEKSNELKTGLAYSGYLMGVFVSLYSLRLITKYGYKNVFLLGSAIYIVSILFFQIDSVSLIYINMFAFCAGMFMLHSAGSGFVNKNVDKNKGVVNGLYVSFYYFGGILGSYLPGLIYENEGWKIFLIFLTAISVSIFLLFTIGFKKAF